MSLSYFTVLNVHGGKWVGVGEGVSGGKGLTDGATSMYICQSNSSASQSKLLTSQKSDSVVD